MGTNSNSSAWDTAKVWLGLGPAETQPHGRWQPLIGNTIAGIVGGAIGWIFFSAATGLTVLILSIVIGVVREAILRKNLTK